MWPSAVTHRCCLTSLSCTRKTAWCISRNLERWSCVGMIQLTFSLAPWLWRERESRDATVLSATTPMSGHPLATPWTSSLQVSVPRPVHSAVCVTEGLVSSPASVPGDNDRHAEMLTHSGEGKNQRETRCEHGREREQSTCHVLKRRHRTWQSEAERKWKNEQWKKMHQSRDPGSSQLRQPTMVG